MVVDAAVYARAVVAFCWECCEKQLRRHAQMFAYRHLHGSGPGPYGADKVRDAIAAVAGRLVAKGRRS